MNPNLIAFLLLVATSASTMLHANENSKPSVIAAAEPSSAGASLNTQKYGPTRKGESLAQVAQQVLTDTTISNEQMMWALFTANPKAFENGKLNRLRAGVYLTVPTSEQARGIDAKTARREIESRTASAAPKPPAAKKSRTGDLDAQIEEAKHERDEAAKEQVFLKARLKEMEDKIQTLLRENAERDAKLRAQSAPGK